MQIIVPAAGRGNRFLDQGIKTPKPMIEVMGKPLVKWSTDGLRGLKNNTYIFLVLREHITEHGIDVFLKKNYPNCQIVPVDEVTQGTACTVLLAKHLIARDEELAIVNCDNLFLIDFARAKQHMAHDDSGIIFYFASNADRWSYVEADEHGYAKRVVEKEVISDRATVGCYYFSKAHYFIDAAEEMIRRDLRVKGEFYVAPTYSLLIEQGHKIKVLPCDLHFSLGTPEEVTDFLSIFVS